MIAELPERGRAERILVSLGPGSFTGVRIGLATARALGLAWSAQVLGFPTLQLVAQMDVAFGPLELLSYENPNPPNFLVCMTGGHGEWFLQPFSPAREPIGPVRSLPPQQAIDLYPQPVVVGSRAREFVELRKSGKAYPALPDARYGWFLPTGFLTSNLAPIYGRPPDARLPA